MELVAKLERIVQEWYKNMPHLPDVARKWLADNVWWIAAVAAVLAGIGALSSLSGVFGGLSTLSSPVVSYYASSSFVTLMVIHSLVSLIFLALECAIFAYAVRPLKERQKKGWVLLFASLLLGAVALVVNAVLVFNPFGFVMQLIFSALWWAIGTYFVFEIRDQFAHLERSAGVKSKKKTS